MVNLSSHDSAWTVDEALVECPANS